MSRKFNSITISIWTQIFSAISSKLGSSPDQSCWKDEENNFGERRREKVDGLNNILSKQQSLSGFSWISSFKKLLAKLKRVMVYGDFRRKYVKIWRSYNMKNIYENLLKFIDIFFDANLRWCKKNSVLPDFTVTS